VLFQADTWLQGTEFRISDGTPDGTFVVNDTRPGELLNPGGGSGYPPNITAIGDRRALFSVDNGEHGRELWLTDATAEGTHMVADIYPGAHGSPGEFTLFG
jgi:ELWxxDGT repeat protein